MEEYVILKLDQSMQVKINYQRLRNINPEAARIAVLEYLSSNGGNVLDCSRVFGVNRSVIYDIVRKSKEGDLKDRSKAPRTIPNKTSSEVEEIIVDAKNKTGLPTKDLSYYLLKQHKIDIAYGTLRHVLRRNQARIKH